VTEITTADFETIKLERADRVAVLTLNRPEALNALNAQLMNETVVTNSVPTVRYSAA
jgi:enoyl-CoA hydratase/carnithine racemase